ncbi:hypothetical protein V496_09074 [Pseudogymnoascus sp. VKM F-4515 (FW-2607)]|nr:hypothetical protein V496_09074 [Pseudogymnoascus sp. VKM F-4515 (FW-2607)]
MSTSATSAFSAEYLAQNRGSTIIVSNATITGFAALVVCTRVFSRLVILKRLGWDDWTIIVATVLAIGNIVLASRSVSLGTGRHIQAVPTENKIPAGIYRFATRVVYFLITGTIKVSVTFLYLRVFPTIRKPTLLLMAVIVSATIAQTLCTVFECVPVAGVWDTASYPNARCINNIAFSYSAACLSVVTDIWALVLPISTVWRLQIPTKRKYVITALFSLGLFACIAGIVRMAFLITLLDSNDPTWDTYGTSIASGWETALAIITTSIPGLKPGFDRIFPKIFSSTKSGSVTTRRAEYELGPAGTRRRERGFESLGTTSEREEDGQSSRRIMGWSEEDIIK